MAGQGYKNDIMWLLKNKDWDVQWGLFFVLQNLWKHGKQVHRSKLEKNNKACLTDTIPEDAIAIDVRRAAISAFSKQSKQGE